MTSRIFKRMFDLRHRPEFGKKMLKFSIRSLLLATLFTAATLAIASNKAIKQAKNIRALRSLGLEVTFWPEEDQASFWHHFNLPKLLGWPEEYTGEIREVATPLDDELAEFDFSLLSSFETIEKLYICARKLHSFSEISNITNLKEFNLWTNEFMGDDFLSPLGQLSQLENLKFSRPFPVAGELDLTFCENLKNLSTLQVRRFESVKLGNFPNNTELWSVHIGAAKEISFVNSEQCRIYSLSLSQIDLIRFDELSKFASIKELDISSSRVVDGENAHLFDELEGVRLGAVEFPMSTSNAAPKFQDGVKVFTSPVEIRGF